MPGRMEFNLSLSRGQVAPRRTGGPMRLLVMADFSGLPPGQRPALAQRPTHRVDFDNLDAVLARLAPRLTLPAGELVFASLEDFHPDQLVARLEVFRSLRELRRRLLDPTTFSQAAAALLQTEAPVDAAKPGAAGPGPDDGLLAQLLGGGAAAAWQNPAGNPSKAAVSSGTGIEAFIRAVVAPHIVPAIAPQQASYLASVDTAIAEQMRAVLHAPAFQAMESAWRGVQWLISSLELDDDLQLHLFDVGRDELLADVVAAQGQIESTGVYRALVDRWRNQPGADGWTALLGLYAFGPSDTDIGLLAALGVLASQAGGPLLAGGSTALAGDDSPTLAGWQALRRSEVARWIGLAAPRVLLRRPYGKASDPIERFPFEEWVATPDHERFLWGNGALACTLLIGRAFSAKGWDFEPGDEREIRDLPAFTCLVDGAPELQACAERYLGEQGGNALLAAGLMPVMSHRQANAVTVMRFQSVAAPAAGLAGLAS